MRGYGLWLLLAVLVSSCTPPSMLTLPSPAMDTSSPSSRLSRELAALVSDAEHPVASVAALAIRDGHIVYQQQFGIRHPGWPPDEAPLPVEAATRYRIASISKLVVALGVLRMVEQGQLALDDDVSLHLGWPLRHPQFADRPITLRRLLTHRSGLSDGGERYFFDGATRLQDVLTPQGPLFANGMNWRHDNPPGADFEYVNLNYGVIAQVMERASGERFDRLMQRLVMQPLGLGASFNPADWPRAQQQQVAALLRKRPADGETWDPTGPWQVQTDDFRQQPAQAPARLEDYVVGSNGSLFGPQGRLRISLPELGVILQMLLAQGQHQGHAFLQPASVAQLGQVQWQRQGPPPAQGENVGACAWGLGVQIFSDTAEPGCGDRLVESGGFSGWGHTGDAYGLMGVFALDPVRRLGMVIVLNGPGVDPAHFASRFSALYRWEEIAATAVYRHALQTPLP